MNKIISIGKTHNEVRITHSKVSPIYLIKNFFPDHKLPYWQTMLMQDLGDSKHSSFKK